MNLRSLAFAAAFATLGPLALAADGPQPPVVLRGTIARIDAKTVSITKTDGTTVTASLAPAASFSTVEPRRFEQIKPTDFVGITSVPGPGGTLRAEEIHVIPDKGFNEGSYPWDHHPEGAEAAASSPTSTHATVSVVHDEPPGSYTMTNASVAESSGMQLKVTYQGSTMVNGKCAGRAAKGGGKPCTGEATVEVSPETPIVAVVPGKAADAKAGLAVFATATKDPQGNLVVVRLVLEKNGVRPLF